MKKNTKDIEDMSRKEFYELPIRSRRKSRDGKIILVKYPLFIAVLCKVSEKPNRYLRVYYNTKYLKKIFGKAKNGYDNTISGTTGEEKSTAGGHFHEKIDELMRSFSLTNKFVVRLKDPKTGETHRTTLGGKPITYRGEKYVKIIIIPAGIAHLVENNTTETMTLSVITSGQHKDSDIHPYEM